MVQFLYTEMKASKLFESCKFMDFLPPPPKQQDIFTVKESDVTYEAFRMMLENKISGKFNYKKKIKKKFKIKKKKIKN